MKQAIVCLLSTLLVAQSAIAGPLQSSPHVLAPCGEAMKPFAAIPVILVLLLHRTVGQDSHRPALKETFEWMHSAFPDSRTVTALRGNETRELNFVEGKGGDPPSCTITIVQRWTTEDGKPVIRDTIIDLSLIDPDSIRSYVDDTVEKGTGVLTMVATNDKKVIIEKIENDKGAKPYFTH